VSLQNY